MCHLSYRLHQREYCERVRAREAPRLPCRDRRDGAAVRPGRDKNPDQGPVPSSVAGDAGTFPEGHRDGRRRRNAAPFFGQGGSATLEDAVVLARSLSRSVPDGVVDGSTSNRELEEKQIRSALGKYVRERRPRLFLLSLESFAFGTLLTAKSLLKKLVCVAVLALLGKSHVVMPTTNVAASSNTRQMVPVQSQVIGPRFFSHLVASMNKH